MGDGSRLAQAHQLPERGRLEGALAGEDFVEDQTQRVDVAPGGDLLARQLLRSHVGRRSSARLLALDARGNSRQPKIGDADFSGAIEHYVGGLEVAMNDAAFVSRRQPGANLACDFRSLVRREPPDAAHHGSEVLTVHVFHRQEQCAVRFANIKNAANVRM